jgi:hypothetical protein
MLCKVIAHNLRGIVQGIYELDIEVDFGALVE